KAGAVADGGNRWEGRPWLVEALKLDESRPAGGDLQRLRLGSILRQTPALVHFWPGATAAMLHPDGKHVAVGENGIVRLIAFDADEPVVRPMVHTSRVSQILFLPVGKMLLAVYDRGGAGLGPWQPTTARLWDDTTGKPLTPAMPLGRPKDGATDVSLSRDGKHVVVRWQG